MKRVNGWRRWRGSAPSPRPRWAPPSGQPPHVRMGVSWRRGEAWCPGSTRRVASRCCWGSASGAIATSGRASSMGLGQSSGRWTASRPGGVAGSRASSCGGEKIGLGWPRPIQRRASPGPYSRRGSAIAPRPEGVRAPRLADAPVGDGLVGRCRGAGRASPPAAAPERRRGTAAREGL